MNGKYALYQDLFSVSYEAVRSYWALYSCLIIIEKLQSHWSFPVWFLCSPLVPFLDLLDKGATMLAFTGATALENCPWLRRSCLSSRGSQWRADVEVTQASFLALDGALWWNSPSRVPCGIRLELDTMSAHTTLFVCYPCPSSSFSPLHQRTLPQYIPCIWISISVSAFHWSSLSPRAFPPKTPGQPDTEFLM